MSIESETAIESELLSLSRKWAAAMVSNDAELIGDFMADEWVMVSERGISRKEHFLGFVASGELTHESFNIVGEARIRVYGETAVVPARVTNTAHYKRQRFDADEWTSDVFVKREGKWQCVLSQVSAAAA